MIVDMDLLRENRRLREELAEKDGKIKDLEEVIDSTLEAPYRGMTAWATSLACDTREHPRKPDDGPTCYCTKRRYDEEPTG